MFLYFYDLYVHDILIFCIDILYIIFLQCALFTKHYIFQIFNDVLELTDGFELVSCSKLSQIDILFNRLFVYPCANNTLLTIIAL